MKRPLTHVAGAEHARGDAKEAERLLTALRVTPEEHDAAIVGPHALHPYPGRMHPLWARRLLASLPEGASVLDPFCGGGTVLVEARLRDLHARGNDINPIAVRLARLKCIPHAAAEDVAREAERCAEKCGERRKTPFSRLAQGNTELPRHVLAGLISLRDEIEQVRDKKTREVLLFCLSPMVDKFSARGNKEAPRVPRDAVRRGFEERAARWLSAWEELDKHRFAEVEEADARWLPWKPGSAGAVISSPPYPGVYDYAAEQARRLNWIGDPRLVARTQEKEIGRRNTVDHWAKDMFFALKQMARTVKKGSPIYLVVGDGVMGGKVVRTGTALEEMARTLPVEVVAIGSQERPHFHWSTSRAFEKHPRCEHLVMLRKT